MTFQNIGDKFGPGKGIDGFGVVLLTDSSNNVISNNTFDAIENIGSTTGQIHGIYDTHFSSSNSIARTKFDPPRRAALARRQQHFRRVAWLRSMDQVARPRRGVAADREVGLALPFVIQRQARDTARAVGLGDRGVLAPGYRADINVSDLDALRLHRPTMRFDLPGGGRRLMQRADGYRHTFVAGRETYPERPGHRSSARPARPRPAVGQPALGSANGSNVPTLMLQRESRQQQVSHAVGRATATRVTL